MKENFPSLITADAQAGLVLAGQLAGQLHQQIARASAQVEPPGGINFQLPPPVPVEITSSILFYAIAAANQGWSRKV